MECTALLPAARALAEPAPLGRPIRGRAGWLVASGLAALVLVVGVGAPLFVRQPLWADCLQYDLEARNVLQGGMPYRDVADVNLPGMVWLHIAVRALLGWSFEALRLVDLLIVAASIGLLVRWDRSPGLAAASRLWTAALLLAFYFSTTELCHCQRDVWMLLPALGALSLRRRRIEHYVAAGFPKGAAWTAILEGALWGMAVWIKPHIAVPALACWLVSAAVVLRSCPDARRHLAADLAWLLVGGLLVGAPGVAWLWWSGAWPYAVECCLHWTRGYVAAGNPPLARRAVDLFLRWRPWGLAHLAALPLAAALVLRACLVPECARLTAQALLAACYLGWACQVLFLQLDHEYAWVVPEFLALILVAGQVLAPGRSAVGRFSFILFGMLAVQGHPFFSWQELALWPECWQPESPAILRDRLTVTTNSSRGLWAELEEVESYLRTQQIQDGELTCTNAPGESLYLQLGIKPATRYLYLSAMLTHFPGQAEAVRQDLNASRQRFVVTGLLQAGLERAPLRQRSNEDSSLVLEVPEHLSGVFPWTESIVFHTPHYVVHRVTGPVERLVPKASDSRP